MKGMGPPKPKGTASPRKPTDLLSRFDLALSQSAASAPIPRTRDSIDLELELIRQKFLDKSSISSEQKIGKARKNGKLESISSSKTTLKEFLQIGQSKTASSEKLAILSRGFRNRLMASTKDVRELIRTPPEVEVDALVPGNKEFPEKFRSSGLIDLNTLLKMSSSEHSSNTRSLPPRRRNSKAVGDIGEKQNQGRGSGSLRKIQIEELPRSSKRTSDQREIQHPTPSPAQLHRSLNRSLRSIDQAAKVAKNLGELVSKVALQEGLESRPLEQELQERASQLASVKKKAKENLGKFDSFKKVGSRPSFTDSLLKLEKRKM